MQVHLYLAPTPDLFDAVPEAALRGILTPEEQDEANRLHFQRDRLNKLGARALLRLALSTHLPVAPRDWRFTRNAYGRPELAGPQPLAPLRFSVTHTPGLLACLIAPAGEIGLDAEPLRPLPDALAIARQFFAPDEAGSLAALPPADRDRRFLELWTLKEAYLKARGLGLALPLSHCAFTLPPGAPPAARLDESGPGRWEFRLHPLLPTHLVATAVASLAGSAVTYQVHDGNLLFTGLSAGRSPSHSAR